MADRHAPSPELEVPANSPPSSVTSVTDTLPKGGRKGNGPEEELGGVTNKVGNAPPSTGLTMPNETKGGTEGKGGSLNIKIHLNLHAKVRLDLDAQIYGDIVDSFVKLKQIRVGGTWDTRTPSNMNVFI
ncbi:hypothetical protein N7523_002904 [Penicillium sp. IBT 18751x]|nr:hypothetical protein N7523_002904 [Penicillium sp. IBT 18751x]